MEKNQSRTICYMMGMKITPSLIRKYQQGACSPEEQRAMEHWLEFGEEESGADDLPSFSEIPNEDEIGVRMQRQLQEAINREHTEKTAADDDIAGSKMHTPVRMYVVRVAAAMLLALFGYLFFLKDNVEQYFPIPYVQQPETYDTLRTDFGRKAKIVLSDGSTVYLNAGSRLVYPKEFASSSRRVFLEGEGFFEVAKQNGKPFLVNTAHTCTEVLGTKFNLCSFKDEQRTYLAVEEGKVRFTASGSQDTLLLAANEAAMHEGQSITDYSGADKQGSWKDGYLIFDNHTLQDIVPVLERWYGVTITLTDSKLATYRMRGRYHDASVKQILDDLAYATGISFRIKEKSIRIYP
ncbi:FecR family protein [Sphingobacterium chuzhouense]|uniref:FecR domain-containing protein n=1 Tax=Sphingobacterium chuzhouense TaxID=1742264 RepID=A0ABR7XXE6_9SPHI|nr:FecR domain-containing protein [Sphingobacterium chuzhouense]MBD1423728.1 FecR domain-containing protein [Sphingobacterium chuzhouense]